MWIEITDIHFGNMLINLENVTSVSASDCYTRIDFVNGHCTAKENYEHMKMKIFSEIHRRNNG